jgi:two-component system response regulator AgrA
MPAQRKRIADCINGFILMENLDMEIALETASPYNIIDYLKKTPVNGLYFLDLDLQCEMNGIALAEEIRKYDPRGFIVFVTADAHSHMLTFKYKIEAMDYIVKNAVDQNERICACIRNAQAKHEANPAVQRRFVFKLSKDAGTLAKGSQIVMDYHDILYIETSRDTPHNLVVHTAAGRREFRGKLSDAVKSLDGRFIKCHRSVIVNADKIAAVDSKGMRIILNTPNRSVDLAAKYLKAVVNRLNP